jgi:hypothetical protein
MYSFPVTPCSFKPDFELELTLREDRIGRKCGVLVNVDL